MQPHSPEQLAGLGQFVDSQVGRETYRSFALGEFSVNYRVVHLDDSVKPFDYAVAAAVVGSGEDAEYQVAVSDDVPEELQGIWAWHELYDFAELGREHENRCLVTEQITHSLMQLEQPQLVDSYLEVRKVFYEGLIQFITQDVESNPQTTYDEGDIAGARLALEFLTSV